MGAVMKRIARFSVFALALAWPEMSGQPVHAQELRNPQIETAYVPPKTAKYNAILDRLKKRRTLEFLAEFISPLQLPHVFHLVTEECGESNAFYSPETWKLTLCYEYVENLERIAPKPGQRTKDGFTHDEIVIGEIVVTLLHEMGHAAFDMLKVPVFGREEDAADQMAIFLALQFSPPVARLITRGDLFYWKNDKNPSSWKAYSDEHGTASQRFYNDLCWVYGGNPQAFEDMIDNLPKRRAENCAAEYELMRAAFAKTILPFIDPALMAKVQQRDWLKVLTGK
jgi:Putative metallopeptidase